MPFVSMTTMKSTPAALRPASVSGWSTLDGSGVCNACWTPGECAKVCATAMDRRLASVVVSRSDCRTSAMTLQTTSTTTSATCRTNTCPATLRGLLPTMERQFFLNRPKRSGMRHF